MKTSVTNTTSTVNSNMKSTVTDTTSNVNSYDNSNSFPRRRKHIVGLLNQGGTCYLNSLLQTLFHTPEFTYRLFNLTTKSNKAGLKSIIRELLRLFYGLMTLRKYAISSKSLTDSFGWTDDQVFVHQDVQELNRLLFEEIETSLKGSVEANLINDLYRGIITTKIKCLRCDNCSVREDEYLDVNLAVLEHDSVESCLKAETIVEKLNGDNQYYCDKCKRKVDAIKAHYFKEYPPILTLCLARFDFDPQTMQSIKVDKTCSFPLILDVSEFMEIKQKNKILYDLFSIVIHVGNSTLGGHYHAYIKDPYGFEISSEDNENNMSCTQLNSNLSGEVHRATSSVVGEESRHRHHFRDFTVQSDEVNASMDVDPISSISTKYDGPHQHQQQIMKYNSTDKNTTIMMTGDVYNDEMCPVAPAQESVLSHYKSQFDTEMDSQSSILTSKKSMGKFSAIFDAIRNFWSVGGGNASCSPPASPSIGTAQSSSSPGEQLSTTAATTSTSTNNNIGQSLESTTERSSTESSEYLDCSCSESNTENISDSHADTNNNELLQSWQSKIFDRINKKEVSDHMETTETEDTAAQIDTKSSRTNPVSNNTSGAINSRSFILGTSSKMRFTSDNPPHKSNDAGQAGQATDNKIDLKFSKSDNSSNDNTTTTSSHQHKQQQPTNQTKRKFIESGRWFDFNDETITEIRVQDFTKVFQGTECAYMLFYRQRNLQVKK